MLQKYMKFKAWKVLFDKAFQVGNKKKTNQQKQMLQT